LKPTFSCRSNKRNTANAIAFEVDYESNLVKLCEEINNGTYQVGRSIAFIVNKPVTREIFAADFRDRIVHHLVISKLNQLFEKQFIMIVTRAELEKEHILVYSELINSFVNVPKITPKIATYSNSTCRAFL